MASLTDLEQFALDLHETYGICGVYDPGDPNRRVISVSFRNDRNILDNCLYTCKSVVRMPELCRKLKVKPGSRSAYDLFNACWKKLLSKNLIFELKSEESSDESSADEDNYEVDSAGEDSEEEIPIKKRELTYFYDRKASDPPIKGLIVDFGSYSERRLVLKNERSHRSQVRGKTQKFFNLREISTLAYQLAAEDGVKRLSCQNVTEYFNYIFGVLQKRGLVERVYA